MNYKVKKKQATAESKDRIIKAAVALFARQGYAGTGLRELAAAADVNLAMINYFFGSKQKLLKAILDVFFKGYLAIARSELTTDDDLQSKIGRFIASAGTFFEAHRDYLIVAITELPHDHPEIVEYKASWGKQMIEIIDREICRPLSAETGSPVSPVVIGPMLTSMMASPFLFAPLTERLRPGDSERVGGEDWQEMISMIFLWGIGGVQKKRAVLS